MFVLVLLDSEFIRYLWMLSDTPNLPRHYSTTSIYVFFLLEMKEDSRHAIWNLNNNIAPDLCSNAIRLCLKSKFLYMLIKLEY